MALKSYKVNPSHLSDDEPTTPKRQHSLKLSELERRVKYRKQSRKATKPKRDVAKTIGRGLQALNRGLAKQSKRMGADKNFEKYLWG